MEIIRETINSNLAKLNKVVPKKYTARELHSQRSPLVQRAQRQENRRYMQNVQKRKIKLGGDLKKIEDYYAALAAEETRRTLLVDSFKIVPSINYTSIPTFLPIETVIPKPIITLKENPQNVLTRRESNKRLRRIR